jgi:peptidoglycan/LPS O-acetylase OafA/YrhL
MKKITAPKNTNIQAMRGIAILMVAVYHFTYRWSDNYYYGHLVKHDYFRFFYMGVQLFFIISGYVIFKTVENTKNFKLFIIKRSKRLIPTLFLVAPLLYVIQNKFYVSNFPRLNPIDIPVSIFIFNPTYLTYIFHVETNFVAGVMWTLTYEITFYFIIGFIYYLISKKYAFYIFVMSLNIILLLNYSYLFFSKKLGEGYSNPNPLYPSFEYVIQQSGLLHLCWFALGMWFYKYEGKKLNLISIIFFIDLLSLAIYDAAGGTSANTHIALSLLTSISTFIFIYFFSKNLKGEIFLPFKLRKFLAVIGDLSYEFYLIHEVIGLIILTQISNLQPINYLLNVVLLILLIPFILFLSYCIKHGVDIVNRK